MDKCFREIIDNELMKRMNESTGVEYTCSVANFSVLSSNVRNEMVKVKREYQFRKALVTRNTGNDSSPLIRFNFIETKKGVQALSNR